MPTSGPADEQLAVVAAPAVLEPDDQPAIHVVEVRHVPHGVAVEGSPVDLGGERRRRLHHSVCHRNDHRCARRALTQALVVRSNACSCRLRHGPWTATGRIWVSPGTSRRRGGCARGPATDVVAHEVVSDEICVDVDCRMWACAGGDDDLRSCVDDVACRHTQTLVVRHIGAASRGQREPSAGSAAQCRFGVVSRHQRQLDELRALCRSGRVGRAVDLAFEHFACFGRDELVVALLIDAIDHTSVTPQIRARLAELSAGADRPGPGSAPTVAGDRSTVLACASRCWASSRCSTTTVRPW